MSDVRKFLFLFLVIFGLSGCVSFTSPLSPEFIPNNSGYIYGKFKQVDSVSFGRLRFGVAVRNVDTQKEYTIQFEEGDDLSIQAYSVPPGRYQLFKLVYATVDYMSAGSDLITNEYLSKHFNVKEDQAVYIGDYLADTNVSSGFNTTTQSWQLKKVEMNYEDTTALFRGKYKRLVDTDSTQAFSP